MKELPDSAKEKIELGNGEINLDAGSGTNVCDGFVNYDINPDSPKLDICDDLWNIEEYFEPNTVSNIRCLEVLEHFKRDEWRNLLGKLCNLIKPGGKLHLRVPSIEDLVDENKRGNISDYDMFRTIYGGQRAGKCWELDFHHCGVNLRMLKDELSKNNFKIEEANHVMGLGLLHVTAVKRNKYDLDEEMTCKECGHVFYRWRYSTCPQCSAPH